MYELGYRLRYFLSNSPLVNAKHAKAGSEQQAAGRREVWFLVEVNRALPGDCLLCMREAWGIGYGLAMSEGQEEICNLQTGFQEIRQYFAPLLPRSKLFLFFFSFCSFFFFLWENKCPCGMAAKSNFFFCFLAFCWSSVLRRQRRALTWLVKGVVMFFCLW